MSDIPKALTRVLKGQYTIPLPLELGSPHQLIIFSDQHKGAGDGADEFRHCRPAYEAALQHYRSAGFTLVLLGDVEELWEQGFRAVRRAYDSVLKLEGSFPAARYYRLWGNHDDEWMSDRKVRKRLAPYMPTAGVYEGLRFEVTEGGSPIGTLLLLHGHQGTFASDKLRWLARLVLRPYRYLQRWFGIGKQTPAQDACLRGDHDNRMYDWAAGRSKLILVAGHTHRPVWSSRTHLQKLEAEFEELTTNSADPQRIEEKAAEVERRRRKTPPCRDSNKPIPCYFNTGCCKFEDGDITGIELEDGQLRLVKWQSRPAPDRHILEEGRLTDIFSRLQ